MTNSQDCSIDNWFTKQKLLQRFRSLSGLVFWNVDIHWMSLFFLYVVVRLYNTYVWNFDDDDYVDEQLEQIVTKLEMELERERLERGWSEAELNRVKTFWEITQRELDDSKREVRNKESSAESAEERHQLEIKVHLFTCLLCIILLALNLKFRNTLFVGLHKKLI